MLFKNLRNSEIHLFDEYAIGENKNSYEWLDYLYPSIQLEKNHQVTHVTPKGDVLLTCRKGLIEVLMAGELFIIDKDQSILIPNNLEYTIKAIEQSRISLVTLFS
ncbi:hypothetical protein LJC17_03255 [Acholeplasma sp. OttesenSCG-928-E16]|nr:hypothetical protein [Acholeplasma sp. OttesenSCG-928-E16]